MGQTSSVLNSFCAETVQSCNVLYFAMFVLDYHVCYRWTFPRTTALGPMPPCEILVSLLSQCQSHWLTWILSLLCSTASSWYTPTNIQYVLSQLMILLQSDCFLSYTQEEGKKEQVELLGEFMLSRKNSVCVLYLLLVVVCCMWCAVKAAHQHLQIIMWKVHTLTLHWLL